MQNNLLHLVAIENNKVQENEVAFKDSAFGFCIPIGFQSRYVSTKRVRVFVDSKA